MATLVTDTITHSKLDNIEIDIESTKSKLDTINTNLGTIETDIETTNSKLDTLTITLTTSNNKLNTINSSLNNTIATNDSNTHTKLDTLHSDLTPLVNINTKLTTTNNTLSLVQTNTNNMETDIDIIKSKIDLIERYIKNDYYFDLRELRRSGKCFSSIVQAWDIPNGTFSDMGYIYNPLSSGKRVFIYQISFGNYKSTVGERISLDISSASSITHTGGQPNIPDKVNLRLSSTNTSVCVVNHRTGIPMTITFNNNGIIESHGINGESAEVTVNYQNEYIELFEGDGLVFQGFSDGSSSININIRWFELDSNYELDLPVL